METWTQSDEINKARCPCLTIRDSFVYLMEPQGIRGTISNSLQYAGCAEKLSALGILENSKLPIVVINISLKWRMITYTYQCFTVLIYI